MSFDRDGNEFAPFSPLPDWLKEFADRELKQGANSPIKEIKEIFNIQHNKDAVEARVKELRERVGLDLNVEEEVNKVAKTKQARETFEVEDDRPDVDEWKDEPHIRSQVRKLDSRVEDWRVSDDGYYYYLEGKYYNYGDEEPIWYILDKKSIYVDNDDDEEIYVPDVKKAIVEFPNTDDIATKDIKVPVMRVANQIQMLVRFANYLEKQGDYLTASKVDEKIKRLADLNLQKYVNEVRDKENDTSDDNEEIPEVLKGCPEVQQFINDLCKSRQGHIDLFSILKMLRDERPEEIDVTNDGLRNYIKRKIEEEKVDLPMDNSKAGYTLFIVEEDEDLKGN